jgi:hypothetical protein
LSYNALAAAHPVTVRRSRPSLAKLAKIFALIAGISAKIRILIFFGAVPGHSSTSGMGSTALVFGAVHEISFPYRHH